MELKWVSCSREADWSTSQHRHLIIDQKEEGTSFIGLTTLCGATASHPEVWRRNKTKTDCPVCIQAAWDSTGIDYSNSV